MANNRPLMLLKPAIHAIHSTQQECRLESFVPDVLLCCDNDYLAIEIYVNHKTEEDKIAFYRQKQIQAIEIDLSEHKNADKETLTRILIDNTEQKSWLSLHVSVPQPQAATIQHIVRPRIPRRRRDIDTLFERHRYSHKNYSRKKHH